MKKFSTSLLLLVAIVSVKGYAQNTVSDTLSVRENLETPVELKTAVEQFFIIDDKPVSREVFMKHLDAKKEEENNSTPQKY